MDGKKDDEELEECRRHYDKEQNGESEAKSNGFLYMRISVRNGMALQGLRPKVLRPVRECVK